MHTHTHKLRPTPIVYSQGAHVKVFTVSIVTVRYRANPRTNVEPTTSAGEMGTLASLA